MDPTAPPRTAWANLWFHIEDAAQQLKRTGRPALAYAVRTAYREPPPDSALEYHEKLRGECVDLLRRT